MATYIYKCVDCKNVFEINATIQEKEDGKAEKFACPKCQSKNIKPEFSIINFFKNIFKSNETNECCSGKSSDSCCKGGEKKDDSNSTGCNCC